MAVTPSPSGSIIEIRPARTRLGRWWLDLPVRRKLLSVVAVIALLCAPAITLAVMFDTRLTEARATARATAAAADQLNALQTSLLDVVVPIQAYAVLTFSDAQYADQYRAAAAPIPGQLSLLVDELPPDLAQPGRELQAAVDALLGDLDAIVDFGASGTQPADLSPDPDVLELNPALVDVLVSSVTTTADAYDAAGRLENSLSDLLADNRAEVDRLQQHLETATIVGMVAALVAAAGGTYLVTSGLVRRIERLSENSDRFLARRPLLPGQPSRDELGELAAVMLFGGELLETRRAEAEAATRAKDDFLSRVSHELKTPLTAMIGFAQLLQESPGLSPRNREDAARIVSAGHQLHGLIQEMLDLKAIEAGKLALAIEPVRLREAVREAAALVRSQAEARSVTVDAHCPADAFVAADRRRLGEVLLNLLSNAVTSSREGGRVDLVATRTDGTVRVAVTDTGPGLSPAQQDLLLAPFERFEAGASAMDERGIGLSLARHVVEAMDGDIGVGSTAGEGSTVWFELPAAPTDGDGRPEPAGTGRRRGR
ncbi:MAG TPA: HAMP domain-containing sensor histidine kinase [Acidimicrobiales bacterium]|nr:HAMP domain-containing sensor histidine kinase [Acidimicrobiales bacterium]